MESTTKAVPVPSFFGWQQINVRTVLLATIVFLSAYLVIRKSHRKWNTPPGPRAWWPILGHLATLDQSSPYRTMAELAKTYGPVVSLQFGSFPVVVLNDYASVHQAFVKQGHEFDDRPRMALAELARGKGECKTFQSYHKCPPEQCPGFSSSLDGCPRDFFGGMFGLEHNEIILVKSSSRPIICNARWCVFITLVSV